MASGSEEAARNRTRAKVYCLNGEGQWDDRGTGHCQIMFMQVRAPPERRGRL